jgi:hypothetical protein
MRKSSLSILCNVLQVLQGRKREVSRVVNDNRRLVASALTICLLSLSTAAWAHGLHREGGRRFGIAGGMLEQLIHPCRADCRDTMHTCADAAESEAVTCAQSTCATQIETAQNACAADSSTQACKDAVSALRECSDSCLTTLKTAVSVCRDTLSDCVDACDTPE